MTWAPTFTAAAPHIDLPEPPAAHTLPADPLPVPMSHTATTWPLAVAFNSKFAKSVLSDSTKRLANEDG